MKQRLTWVAYSVATVLLLGFLVFLYNVPPFFLVAPEVFGSAMASAAPPVSGIADPAERAIAEHGRTLVMNTGCIGCHATNGARGPDLTKYLAGGAVKLATRQGTFVSRNLTPDPETGLARRSDDEVMRALRSGTFPDGHVASYTTMPWAGFSTWSEEDRYAVVKYLRSLPPVSHGIPEPSFEPADLPTHAVEGIFGLRDYGIN